MHAMGGVVEAGTSFAGSHTPTADIVGPAAALGRDPVDVLGRVLDVAGLAVHAVLRVDLQRGAAVRAGHVLVDPGRAVALLGPS